MNWFYWSDGERIGPISAAELKRLAQTGVVSPSTTVEDETGKSALAERVAVFRCFRGESRTFGRDLGGA